MKVLLVDDEIEFVNTLSNRLGMRGIETDVVHDGDEALDYVAKQEPDVIVLDLKMPRLHGMEVLRRLSKTNPNIQVVVLTGHGRIDIQEERVGGAHRSKYVYPFMPSLKALRRFLRSALEMRFF